MNDAYGVLLKRIADEWDDVGVLLRPMLPGAMDIRVDLAAGVRPVGMAALHLNLQQMLMNLCIDARDAMPDGGVLSVSVNPIELHGGSCAICNTVISTTPGLSSHQSGGAQ